MYWDEKSELSSQRKTLRMWYMGWDKENGTQKFFKDWVGGKPPEKKNYYFISVLCKPDM